MISLKEIDTSIFSDAALAFDQLINDDNPDIEKVYECSKLFFTFAIKKQYLNIAVIISKFLTKEKITAHYRDREPCSYFKELGDTAISVYSDPSNAEDFTLVTLRENCLTLHKIFLDEKFNSRRPYRFSV